MFLGLMDSMSSQTGRFNWSSGLALAGREYAFFKFEAYFRNESKNKSGALDITDIIEKIAEMSILFQIRPDKS
jgi:hypothetical protein